MGNINKDLSGMYYYWCFTGDHCYKQNSNVSDREQMITALPDIRTATLTDEDEFMVLACDGIW